MKENEPVLHIENKKYIGESTVISLRLPKDMLEAVDSLAKSTGNSRNEILQKFIEFSLTHLHTTN